MRDEHNSQYVGCPQCPKCLNLVSLHLAKASCILHEECFNGLETSKEKNIDRVFFACTP
jgi:hypothetical protein